MPKKLERFSQNPFTKNLTIQKKSKKITVSSSKLGKENEIFVNHSTGEVLQTTVESTRVVENQEFVKIFAKNIALTFNLSSAGIKAFNILIWCVQNYAFNKDVIQIDEMTLEDFIDKNPCNKVAKTTMYRGINELVDSKIIARHKKMGFYFINPSFCFNGDRIVFMNSILRKEGIKNYEKYKTIDTKESDENRLINDNSISGLLVTTYNIPEQKAKELATHYPIETIELVIKKIEELKRINSHVVDPRSKIPSYMVYCIENNLTEINQVKT